jgi:hypothetical protein
MKTPIESWNHYRSRVLPPHAGEVQIAETRRAFLAGMVAMESILEEIAALPSAAALDALSAIKDQLLQVSLGYVAEARKRSDA